MLRDKFQELTWHVQNTKCSAMCPICKEYYRRVKVMRAMEEVMDTHKDTLEKLSEVSSNKRGPYASEEE